MNPVGLFFKESFSGVATVWYDAKLTQYVPFVNVSNYHHKVGASPFPLV